jgi:hypothetical protein
MLGRVVLRPSVSRLPHFDMVKEGGRFFQFVCVECGRSVTIDLGKFLGFDTAKDDIFGSSHANAIHAHFEFNVVGKSHDGGWPRLRSECCPHCGTRYLVYVGIREPTNSRSLVTVQGITEWTGDPKIEPHYASRDRPPTS